MYQCKREKNTIILPFKVLFNGFWTFFFLFWHHVIWFQEVLQPVFYPSPSVSRPVSHLTEEEQVKIAKRIGLIQHLPVGLYDGCKKARECVICMIEFNVGDSIRYLPCMHTYHVGCIDDWLMRSLTCPSCMEPVDAALLTTYETC